MTVSGRFVALVAFGVVPVIAVGMATGEPGLVLGAWLLFALALGVLDILLAASPRLLVPSRSLPPRTRLGETVTSQLFLTNSGRRTLRGLVRDAWQPSAGAAVRRSRVTIPAGERRLVSVPLTPFRRGERR